MAGIVQLADHGLHGLIRSCGTPDSLLLMHGLLPTTGQHAGRYNPRAAVSEQVSQSVGEHWPPHHWIWSSCCLMFKLVWLVT